MKIDPSFCRLCFTHADEPIDIFGDAATEFNIFDVLAQYFLDQVTQDDALPKVVCHDCWSQIETFNSFVQRVIAVREDYLRQHLNERFKEEEVPDEFSVSMDEMEIHQENVCIEPASIISEDPLKGEVELMDTQFQIDMDNEENGAILSNDDGCVDIVSNTNQIGDQNSSDTKQLSSIDAVTGAKSSASTLKSESTKKIYVCAICNKKFGSQILAQKHLSTHPKKPTCHICNKRFESQQRLDHHLKSSHFGGLDGYGQEVKEMVLNVNGDQIKGAMDKFVHEKTCDSCSTEFSSFLDARSHYLKFHNSLGHLRCCNIRLKSNNQFLDHIYWHYNPTVFECRLCHKDQKTRAQLLMHIKGHKALKKKEFTCEYCKKHFRSSSRFAYHMSSTSCSSKIEIHPNDRSLSSDDPPTEQPPSDEMSMNKSICNQQNKDVAISDYFDMTCDLCPVVFTSFEDASSHYLDVHSMENGYLKCCQVKFKKMTLIMDHLAWHKDPNAFRCDLCNKYCLSRRGLCRHKKTHARDFVCSICAKTYAAESKLTKHMLTHEKRERRFICGVCNKGFYDKAALHTHEKRHKPDKKHICEFCAKIFISSGELITHVKSHDQMESERQFQCNICEKWLMTKYTLATHMTRHNSGPQKCDQCDKISPNIGALHMHVRAVHCESKFECHLCDKKFKLKAALKDHIATHKGERNYKCTFCDETFIWRMNMYAHRKKMHKEEWMAEKEKQLKP